MQKGAGKAAPGEVCKSRGQAKINNLLHKER